MTEYSGAKAPNDRPDDRFTAQAIQIAAGILGDMEPPTALDITDVVLAVLRSAWDSGFRAGQRAQAEKDAEIAKTHPASGASWASREDIAAAIRAAAPKEGE